MDSLLDSNFSLSFSFFFFGCALRTFHFGSFFLSSSETKKKPARDRRLEDVENAQNEKEKQEEVKSGEQSKRSYIKEQNPFHGVPPAVKAPLFVVFQEANIDQKNLAPPESLNGLAPVTNDERCLIQRSYFWSCSDVVFLLFLQDATKLSILSLSPLLLLGFFFSSPLFLEI